MRVGVPELHLLQIARAKGLFLGWLGHVERDVDPLVGQRERRFADDEMLSRRDFEVRKLFAFDEDRVALGNRSTRSFEPSQTTWA